jgi:hypothetical protein
MNTVGSLLSEYKVKTIIINTKKSEERFITFSMFLFGGGELFPQQPSLLKTKHGIFIWEA